MARLELTELSKSFDGSKQVLDSIDLVAEHGEFVVLVGPSGCGKSTLLRLIAGLEEPDRGDIQMERKSVVTLSPSDRNIAMVFQDYALYPHMTVHGNMAFGLKIRGLPKSEIERRVSDVSRLLEISDLLHRKPAQLSGGQRQRVAIGRAIVRDPSLFLFDEPLSNLDAKLRAQMRLEIASLHKRLGNTVIYVTHDQEEAMTLADKIVVLHEGRIQQVGSPLELYRKPANSFVASFIGNPTMNLIPGRVTEEQGLTWQGQEWQLKLDNQVLTNDSSRYALMGIRPENIKWDPQSDLQGSLQIKEMHGHEMHIVVTLGRDQIISRVRDRVKMDMISQVKIGERVGLRFEQAEIHWFDGKGTRL